MPYRNRSLLCSSSENETMVLSRQVGLLTMSGRVRRFNQSCPQPGAAFACFATEPLACAFAVAWAHARPRGKVSSAREALHIGANFRQDHFCQASFDAGN